ncbi:BTAD domain-containing putative transcriptional regulator [Longispora sp. NPDC051575]|uniref:AfsR/SARP family transcriptional regulator n=1 Tax=Longispora sp. NPDC051575 TaxID=3154943 RepID=UPI003434D066
MTQADAGTGLTFRILGPLEVWSDGARLAVGGVRQERVLGMLLLAANQVVPLPRLVEAAWEDDPPPTASHQVRKMVADLRRRLGTGSELISTDGPGYRIDVDVEQLDLRLFEVRLTRAREADAAGLPHNTVVQLQAALDLWRGKALSGLDSAAIMSAAAVLEERRLAATEHLMDLRLAMGEARELVSELRALLSEHPLREALRGHLMLALYRSGRQADALHLYEETRHLLAEELGIDPGTELVKLHERILRNSSDLDPPTQPAPVAAVDAPPVVRPNSLPYDVPDFTGRGEEVDRLLAGAAEAGLSLFVIDGMPGVGKTALAVHVAHRAAEQYPDGQVFIDLHGFTPGREPLEPCEALEVMLRAMGVPGDQLPDDLEGRAARWRVQVAGRRLVVVLDNAAEYAQIRPLLPGTPGCMVLVTSRARLAGLDGATPLSVDVLSQAESLALFTRVLGRDLAPGEHDAAADLIEVCGRLPLALRIAAARCQNRPQWTVNYLLERLRAEDRQLGELVIGDRSVASAISLSYRFLGPDHRRLFRLLGLHTGTDFDLYAAAALADLPAATVEALLEDLLDAHLLTQRVLDRYTFHDLVRRYAQITVQAEEPDTERRHAVHRLLDYYLHTAHRAADLLQPGRAQIELRLTHPPATAPAVCDFTASLTWFDAERANLIAAVRRADRLGMDQHACHLPRDLSFYLLWRGHIHDEMAMLHTAVEAARRLGDHDAERRSLLNLSLPYWHVGRLREAVDYASQSHVLATKIGDLSGEGAGLNRMGSYYGELGQFTEAMRCYERALEIHQLCGDRRDEASALIGLSYVLATIGRNDEAITTAQRGVAIERELGSQIVELTGLMNEALGHAGLGDLPTAFRLLDRTMVMAKDIGAPGRRAIILAHYAEFHRRQGDLDRAEDCGRQALELLWALRRPAIGAMVENILGAVHRDRGEHVQALKRHQQAFDMAREIDARLEIAKALDGLAFACRNLDRPDEAALHARTAADHYDAMGIPAPDTLNTIMDTVRPT